MTTETDTSTTVNQDPEWDEGGLEDETTDDFEGVSDGDGDTAQLEAARAELRAAEKAYRDASLQQTFDRRVAAYRELGADQQDAWLDQIFKREDDRADFKGAVAAIQRTELIDRLAAGDDEALLAGYRAGDPVLRAELEDVLPPDRRRMIRDRSREHVVELPAQEPNDDGTENELDFAAAWSESPMSANAKPDDFAKAVMADVRQGRVQVDAAIKSQLEGLLAEADRYPNGYAQRGQAFNTAAGLAAWVQAEHEASVPFGRIQSTRQYMAPDRTWRQVDTDDRGQVRESLIEEALAPRTETATKAFDPDSIRSIGDTQNLTVDQWAKLRAADPDKAEQLLRATSEAMDEAHRAAKQAGQA